MQVDAAQHLVVTEGFAQAPDGQRKRAGGRFRTAPKQPRLFDEVGAIDRLGAAERESEGLLACFPQCFWKAGCQDSVSRSSAREALSASLPSSA